MGCEEEENEEEKGVRGGGKRRFACLEHVLRVVGGVVCGEWLCGCAGAWRRGGDVGV